MAAPIRELIPGVKTANGRTAFAGRRVRRRRHWLRVREFLHHCVELVLRLEPDAGPVGQSQIAIFDFGVIREPGKHAEYVRVRLAAAEPEAADDGERHLVAAVGKYRMPLPFMALEHFECARELNDSVRLRPVDLNNVTVGPNPAEAEKGFVV